MENLFDIPESTWKLERKVRKLRERIYLRSRELSIQPEHNELGHFYRVNNELYPSVSAEHRNIKDPSIRNFERNEVGRYISEHYQSFTPENIDEHVKLAVESPILVRDKAGSKGNFIHDCRQIYFQKWIDSNQLSKPKGSVEQIARDRTDIPEIFKNEVISGCAAIDTFIKEKKYIPIACEVYVFDLKTKIAGTLDDVGIINGEVILMDVKSSNQMKDIYTLQVMRYKQMFVKVFKTRIHKVLILKTGKQDRTYQLEWFSKEQERAGINTNKHLERFNHYWQAVQESRKPKIVTI